MEHDDSGSPAWDPSTEGDGPVVSKFAPGHEPFRLVDAPPERVGLLLAEARTRRGFRLDDVADRLEGRLDATHLMALESGAIQVPADVFADLGRIYGVEANDLVPPRDRLIVDLNEGYLRAGPDIALLNDGTGRREVLSSYLEMIWELRELERGAELELRDADLEALSVQLRAEPDSLAADLRRLMAAAVGTPRRRTRVLVGLGAALAVVTGGVLLWQDSEPPAAGEPAAVVAVAGVTEDRSEVPAAPSAEIGDAAVQERGSEQEVRGGDPEVPVAPDATRTDLESLMPAPSAEIGDAAVLERNPDGTPAEQQTR